MRTRITATELARGLSDVLNRVRYRGEAFVVERGGEVIADLGPAETPRGITALELVSRLGDLALPGDGFADDLAAIQAEQPKEEAPEWPS